MNESLRVLIVEDSEDDARLYFRELEEFGYNPTFQRVHTREDLIAALGRQSWDIVIANPSMPHLRGPELVDLLKERELDLPYIFVTNNNVEGGAQSQFADGTAKYVAKEDRKQILTAVERELHEAAERKRRKQVEEKLRYLIEYDPLTNLPNRELFHERLERAVEEARAEKKSLVLLLMGLDRFKEINHTLGPRSGDLLLKEVGYRFENVLKRFSTKSRLGGDEFATFLPGSAKEEALRVGNKILETLEVPFMIDDLPIDLGGSIGIACYPEHGETADLLLRRAGVAMYLAKQHGHSCSVYDSANDPYNQQRLAILGGLRNAIEQNQLVLHYQPRISFQTAHATGVEALLRWHHPQLGLIPPDQFVPLAERTGLIHALSLWVLKASLDQCRAWHQAGLDLSVAVNLSPRNLHDPQLPEHIGEMLASRGLSAGSLELEITESVIMSDPVRAMEVLTELNRMGIRVFIDDFGNGYSSLGYLKKLPVFGIKIDKSFVIHMAADENDAVIVRSTIELGHNLGLRVIAEGVERKEIWERLGHLGCDEAQGYYFSPAIPPNELSRWMRKSPWGLLCNSEAVS